MTTVVKYGFRFKGLLSLCYGLNHVPPLNAYIEVLIPQFLGV